MRRQRRLARSDGGAQRRRRLATVLSQAYAAPACDSNAVKFTLAKLENSNIYVKPQGKERTMRRLTVLAAVAAATIGSALILADPIFQGLAISLVFGLASSTALTLLAIPAIYAWLRDDGRPGENLGST